MGYAEALYTPAAASSRPDKGNRNEVDGKEFVGNYDLVVSGGGANGGGSLPSASTSSSSTIPTASSVPQQVRPNALASSLVVYYDDGAACVTFWTGCNQSPVVAIKPGTLEWQRLQLSDGTFARLVTSMPGR